MAGRFSRSSARGTVSVDSRVSGWVPMLATLLIQLYLDGGKQICVEDPRPRRPVQPHQPGDFAHETGPRQLAGAERGEVRRAGLAVDQGESPPAELSGQRHE